MIAPTASNSSWTRTRSDWFSRITLIVSRTPHQWLNKQEFRQFPSGQASGMWRFQINIYPPNVPRQARSIHHPLTIENLSWFWRTDVLRQQALLPQRDSHRSLSDVLPEAGYLNTLWWKFENPFNTNLPPPVFLDNLGGVQGRWKIVDFPDWRAMKASMVRENRCGVPFSTSVQIVDDMWRKSLGANSLMKDSLAFRPRACSVCAFGRPPLRDLTILSMIVLRGRRIGDRKSYAEKSARQHQLHAVF